MTSGLSGICAGATACVGKVEAWVNACATAVSEEVGSCTLLPSGRRCPADLSVAAVAADEEDVFAAAVAGVTVLGLLVALPVGVAVPVAVLSVWLI